jgi:hypothetical protein
MNLFKIFSQPFKKAIEYPQNETLKDDQNITATGKIIDKRDIEDPTAKFYGPVHITRVFKTQINRRNVSYAPSEYDLPILANAIQLDGILRRYVNIYVEQILKNWVEINSRNDKIQKHIYRRLKEIQNFTGVSFRDLLTLIATQLVTYGNAYVIKVRGDKTSKFGKPIRIYGKNLNPIVGLFVADASTMQIGLNNDGEITTYKQEIRGEMREWDERDVIHFAYNRIPGTLTGMSNIIPILDDVRALRKLEEEIEILGFQYSIPLYLYKVGNKDIPAAPGEVAEVSVSVANMPAYGMLVVPGHHDISVPANANSTIDIIKYVEHFKKRIFAGLAVSPVAMGESDSSNRNTAQVSDLAMQTTTKSFQNIIKTKAETELFKEFLLDGGFKDIDDEAELKFPEIDIETQIKYETHIIAKWQNNLITRTESRNEMDYDNNIKDNDTFLRLVDIPKIDATRKLQMEVAQLNADTQIKLAKMKPAPSAGGEKAGATQALPKPGTGGHSITKIHHKVIGPSKAAKSTSNKVAPANQHGKATRPKYVKNSADNIFDGLSLFNKDSFSKSLETDIEQQFSDELDYTINTIKNFYHIDSVNLDRSIIDKYFSGLFLLIEDKVDRASRILEDSERLDLFSSQTKKFLDEQSDRICNLAKILVYKSLDVKTILITSENCDKHSDVNIDLSNLDYSKIPPFGYQCKCSVSENRLDEKHT